MPPTGNTPLEMADDLAALLDSLGAGPVIAVGHSMGGQVVNLLAVRHAKAGRQVCVRHTSARCSARRTTSLPRPTPACTPSPARSVSARTARRICAAVRSPRSPSSESGPLRPRRIGGP
nr:alpha/beta hydrolase [Streptomyces bicolor]